MCPKRATTPPNIPKGDMLVETLRTVFVEGAHMTKTNYDAFIQQNGHKYRHFVFIHNSSPTAKKNKHYNYEYWEIMGDGILNHLAVNWIGDNYPQFRNADGVKVIAQLKIKMVSTDSWARLATKHQFHTIIDCDPALLFHMPKNVLEDVFEAFYGLTMHLCGYDTCKRLFNYMLRHERFSTAFEDLFDPIQRLQQLKDKFKFEIHEECQPMGTKKTCYMYYSNNSLQSQSGHCGTNQKHTIYYIQNDARILIGNGDGEKLVDARRIACNQAIGCLAELGFTLETPDIYDKPAPTTKRPAPPDEKPPRVLDDDEFPALGQVVKKART